MDSRRKLFNPENNQLLYLDREANENFWDRKWELAAKETFANPPRHRATVRITKRYLPVGARVLEGGCGLGDVVNAFNKAGYQADGIDYAPRVVAAINQNWPHLNVSQGDVRHLSVEDGYYDGYWSIGVIEHFPEGYQEIVLEMARVLKKGGYLFLSFPSFNRFRQHRAKTGKYVVSVAAASDTADFFQFALDPIKVAKHLENLGFETVDLRGVSSLQCLAEDLPLCMGIQRFLDYLPSRVGTAISMLLDQFIGKYAGHSSLLIMRKNI